VTKKGHLTMGFGRRRHHGKDFVRQRGNACELREAMPTRPFRILDGNPFDVRGESLGKRNVKGRGSTGMRKYV
jgi:hypothetical protein